MNYDKWNDDCLPSAAAAAAAVKEGRAEPKEEQTQSTDWRPRV